MGPLRPFPILQLPPEVLHMIAERGDAMSRVALRNTCHSLRAMFPVPPLTQDVVDRVAYEVFCDPETFRHQTCTCQITRLVVTNLLIVDPLQFRGLSVRLQGDTELQKIAYVAAFVLERKADQESAQTLAHLRHVRRKTDDVDQVKKLEENMAGLSLRAQERVQALSALRGTLEAKNPGLQALGVSLMASRPETTEYRSPAGDNPLWGIISFAYYAPQLYSNDTYGACRKSLRNFPTHMEILFQAFHPDYNGGNCPLRECCDEVKDNKELVRYAIKTNREPSLFQFASLRLKKDKAFVIELLKEYNIFAFIDPSLQEDPKVQQAFEEYQKASVQNAMAG